MTSHFIFENRMPNLIDLQSAEDLTSGLLDELLVLEAACFPEDPWTAAMFAVNEQEGILLARETGRLVAYLCYQQILDECHILNVAVHPDRRRRSIAEQLVTHLIQGNPAIRDCFLEVRENNRPAIGLYEKLGFRVIGRRLRYYRNGEHALVMQYRLNDPIE